MKKLAAFFVFLSASLILLAGCFALPVEDPVPSPPAVSVPQAQAFPTAVVMRGDVVRYTNAGAFYVATRDERLLFDIAGLPVLGIFVGIGDYVREGDVVASLYHPEIQEQYELALRRDEILRLSRAQLGERHALVLYHAESLGEPVDDAYYVTERARLGREHEILSMELDFLRRENDRRYLRASMSGHVVQVMPFLQGMVSDTSRTVVSIADQQLSAFEVRSADAVANMEIGEYFILSINREPYEAVVVDPDEIGIFRDGARGDEVYLMLLDETVSVPVGVTAIVNVEMAAARNVLFVPLRAINYIGERTVVYVLNDQGMRSLRDVEVGLRGNTSYEVVSGLAEGEVVVIG